MAVLGYDTGDTATPARKGMAMMVSATNKIACYLRVSTVGQNEAGQRAEIERWLTGHGIDPASVAWYLDKETGTKINRKQLDKLRAAIFAGEVDTVIVWKLDRLSRSLQDGLNLLCDWLNEGVRLVSVSQQFDFAGATGKLIASVLFAVAELEQETRRERQAAGIKAAKKRGVYTGRQQGTTKATPDRAREMRERGLTDDEIATALGVSRRSVQRYLRAVGA